MASKVRWCMLNVAFCILTQSSVYLVCSGVLCITSTSAAVAEPLPRSCLCCHLFKRKGMQHHKNNVVKKGLQALTDQQEQQDQQLLLCTLPQSLHLGFTSTSEAQSCSVCLESSYW